MNWTRGLDPKTGRPLDYDPGKDVQTYVEGTTATRTKPIGTRCPAVSGGKNWEPAAYNPELNRIYIPSSEGCNQIEGVTQYLPRVDDYLKLATGLVLAMGLCFQLPVILSLLGMAGIIGSATLMSAWRYAIVGVFAVAAVITPPDPISMLSLAFPICALYFVSIWCVKLIELRRGKEEAAEEP